MLLKYTVLGNLLDGGVYGVIENGVCVAYIIISEKEFGDKTHHFREIWVTPELRGRGYASILILFLLNKLKLKLFIPHDEIVSPMIRVALGKLFSSGKIKIDVNTERPVEDVLIELFLKVRNFL